jgi:hypothetical protein
MNHLLNFINVALDKLQTHSLHQKKLDVVFIDLTVGCDAIKLQAAVVLFNFKEKLQEGDNTNFLLKRS